VVKQINSISMEEEFVGSSGETIAVPPARFVATAKDAEQASQDILSVKNEFSLLKRSIRNYVRTLEEEMSNTEIGIIKSEECRDIKIKNLSAIVNECERLGVDIEVFKSKSDDENNRLDENIERYRQTIMQLKSTERADVDGLSGELKQWEGEVMEAMVTKDSKKEEGLRFLDNATTKTKYYIDENEERKKAAIRSVELLGLSKLEKIKSAAAEVLLLKKKCEKLS